MILHVVDVSSPHAPEYVAHVTSVLSEIGAAGIPQILVMNKMDRLPPSEADQNALAARLLGAVRQEARVAAVSALTGAGIDRLLSVMDEAVSLDPIIRTTLRIAAGDGATLALLHEFGNVLKTRYESDWCELEVEIPESLTRRLKQRE